MKAYWEIKKWNGSEFVEDKAIPGEGILGWCGGTNKIPNPATPVTVVRASQDERVKLFDGKDAVLSPEERIASETLTFTISELRQSEIREITAKIDQILNENPQVRRQIITHEEPPDKFQGIFKSYTKEYLPGLVEIGGDKYQLSRLTVVFELLRPEF